MNILLYRRLVGGGGGGEGGGMELTFFDSRNRDDDFR